MASYDNPAGRLHELLRRLNDINPNSSLLAAWAEVLNVPEPDVHLRLGGVGQLVADVQKAVEKSGEQALIAPVSRYRAQWANDLPSRPRFRRRNPEC